MGEEPYYTVKDVVRLTNYSVRQIERFLEDGTLEEIDHQPHHKRKISQASVKAFIAERGIRTVDEVDKLKKEQLEEKQATGEVARQVVVLQARVEKLEHQITQIFVDLATKFRASGGQRSRGSAPAGPDGAIMLVDFARAHTTTIGKLRGLAERDPTLATVIERPGAKEKKKKWMIKPEQMAPMLAALEKRGFTYTPCTSCPHTADAAQAPELVAEEPSLAQ